MSNPYPLAVYEVKTGRLPGWANEPIMLTIPAGSVTGVLEDFPVMVKLSGASGANHADVSKVFVALGSDANRKRICVTAGDGITPCYVEIKEWSTATQTAYLWVRVPRIDPGLDTRLYLYYDQLHAEMTDYVGDTGETAAQRVWENGYAGVWHTKTIPATKKTLYAGEVSSSAIGGAAATPQVAFGPIDCTGLIKGNGWLKIDLKCDLPENLTGDSQLEITSAGGPDTQEWHLVNVHGTYGISTEWRTYYLPLSAAYTTGTELDPARINFIRWYVYVLMAGGAPTTTISWRNAEIISTADLPDGTNVPILLDATQNQNHGMIYGATETDGPLGRCLSFDGVDDRVVFGTTDIPLTEFTGEVYTSPQGGYTLWHPNSKHWWVRYISQRMEMHLKDSASSYVRVDPTHSKYDEYGYFVWGYRAGEAYGAVDGVYNSVSTTRTFPNLNMGGEYGAICANFSGRYAGDISLISVSTVARSPAWIAATNLSLRDELIVYSDPGAPLTLAAYVDAYEYFSWTRRYRRPGAWKCQINRYLPAAKEFVPGRLVHFKRNGEDRLGIIETRQISVDENGKPSEMWTVAGREISGALAGRNCLAGVSSGSGYDEITDDAETVMHHYVDTNCINPTNSKRIIPFLMHGTDGEKGAVTTQSARFDVLTDLLETIATAAGLGWRLRWSWTDRRLYFEVMQGVDKSASVTLSPNLGNCIISGYNESTGESPSSAIVAGQGEAAARALVTVGDDLIGFDRRETFVDARDVETEAELLIRGAEKLAEEGDTTTLTAEYLSTGAFVYGTDFDLGDIITVEYPDVAMMEARIVAIEETYERNQEKLNLTMGTEWPDVISVLRAQRKKGPEIRK